MRFIDVVFLYMININLSFRNIEKDIELDNFLCLYMYMYIFVYF